MNVIKLMLVDDHQVVLDGLRILLSGLPEIKIINECRNEDELNNNLKSGPPDIILLDITLPGRSGIEIARTLLEKYPLIKIIFFTGNTDEEILYEAIEAGANGILLKNSSRQEIINAINKVHAGEDYLGQNLSLTDLKNFIKIAKSGSNKKIQQDILTTREIEIIKLLADGFQYKEIASMLNISIRTVETYKNTILHKLELKSVVDIVKYAIKNKIIEI